jgi:hypothetical protein
MLKLAIIRLKGDNTASILIDGRRDEFEFEIKAKIFKHLGGKDRYTPDEIASAVDAAFGEYKQQFKEKTVNLP